MISISSRILLLFCLGLFAMRALPAGAVEYTTPRIRSTAMPTGGMAGVKLVTSAQLVVDSATYDRLERCFHGLSRGLTVVP